MRPFPLLHFSEDRSERVVPMRSTSLHATRVAADSVRGIFLLPMLVLVSSLERDLVVAGVIWIASA